MLRLIDPFLRLFRPRVSAVVISDPDTESSPAVAGPPFWIWVAALCTVVVYAAIRDAVHDPHKFLVDNGNTVVGAITAISALGLGYRGWKVHKRAQVAIAGCAPPPAPAGDGPGSEAKP